MKGFRQLFGIWPARSRPVRFTAPLAPARPFYVIGDIHGRDDLLERLIGQIRADSPAPRPTIICVGDYVDRGEASADVLVRLFGLCESDGVELHCLLGNHEDMMLKFLADPRRQGGRWLRNGGLQTLASFGVARVSENTSGPALERARDQLRAAMGPALAHWLRTRPVLWSSGNVCVVHAGADPARPPEDQPREILLWGHSDFATTARRDGRWIVSGHTIVAAPQVRDGRIAVDTGAYATGRLSGACITAGAVRFLQT